MTLMIIVVRNIFGKVLMTLITITWNFDWVLSNEFIYNIYKFYGERNNLKSRGKQTLMNEIKK